MATIAPRDPQVILNRAQGPETYATEVVHGYTVSILDPNMNINGAVQDPEMDPLLITQGTVRVTAPGGQIGFGVVDREIRRSSLPSPDPR